eukprot:8525389-Heterocapsa_arctica.AAC.1
MDASPWGAGAIVWAGEYAGRYDRRPFAWLAVDWETSDNILLQAKIGDPGSQAIWEAYIFLLAVRQWISKETRGPIK